MDEYDFNNYRTYSDKKGITVEEALRIIENPETSDAMREYLSKKVNEVQKIRNAKIDLGNIQNSNN